VEEENHVGTSSPGFTSCEWVSRIFSQLIIGDCGDELHMVMSLKLCVNVCMTYLHGTDPLFWRLETGLGFVWLGLGLGLVDLCNSRPQSPRHACTGKELITNHLLIYCLLK